MDDYNIPINVIVLDDCEKETENLIDVYYDIVKSCKKSSEVKTALAMMLSENRELVLREILIRDIANKAKILEETKNH